MSVKTEMETITFISNPDEPQMNGKGKGQNIQMTVKIDFVHKFPNYQTTSMLDLLKECEIMNYWHNPNGPAVIDLKSGHKTYCLDGKPVLDEEEKRRILHREEFGKKADEFLNEKL